MKRAIIVHCWGDTPKDNWYLWLKKELEKNHFHVQIPEMPETDEPKINAWVNKLEETIDEPDENLVLIGHSIGCQTIMRYLESTETKIKGAVYVAGWFSLTGLETEDEIRIARPWLEKIDLEEVRRKCEKSVAIFSSDDPLVPLKNMKIFDKELSSEIIVEENKGHFTSRDNNVTELPSALNAVLSL